MLFRPAGHGALLENLNEIDADVIFIKNIDNVAPDRLKTDTVTYKKVIGGVMLALQQRCHSYLRSLYNGLNDKVLIGEIARFTEERLGQRLPRDFERLSLLQRPTCFISCLTGPSGSAVWCATKANRRRPVLGDRTRRACTDCP